MPIKINSTGGGSVSIDVPSTGGTYTLTAPANNATIFTTDGGAITGNVGFSGVVSFSSNNVSIGGQTASPYGAKNKIINGAMSIDQRYSGSSNTINSNSTPQYNLDRWICHNNVDGTFSVRQMDGSNTSVSNYESGAAPAGFTNSLKITVTSADASIGATQNALIAQYIEGNNLVDMDFGTSTAKTFTLSFWIKSSVTGTFGGALNNGSYNRAYAFSYVINAANTWEYKTVTIAGDTTGTWFKNSSTGLSIWFSLACGSTYTAVPGTWASTQYYGATGQTQLMSTLNATWYITGVQLEVGSVATPFEVRSYGQELALCQRYYEVLGRGMIGTSYSQFIGVGASYKVTKRATPTVTLLTSSPTFYMFAIGIVTGTSSTINVQGNDTSSIGVYFAGMPNQAVTGYFCTSTTDSLLSIAAEL